MDSLQHGKDTPPRVRGVFNDNGRLMILITYNADLGDAWEWMDDPDYRVCHDPLRTLGICV